MQEHHNIISSDDEKILSRLENPDKAKQTQFELSDDLQTALVAQLIRDDGLYNATSEHIKPEYFTDKALATIYRAVKHYKSRYEGKLNNTVLRYLVNKRVSSEAARVHYEQVLNDVIEVNDTSTQFLHDDVLAFCKRQNIKAALSQTTDLLTQGRDELLKNNIDLAFNTGQSSDTDDFHWCEQLQQLPKPEWLIDQLFQKKGLAVMFGAEATYKSYAGIDLCLSVASGKPFLGHYQVKQGYAAYFAAEGFAFFADRVKAWQNYHKAEIPPQSFLLSDRMFKLADESAVQQIIAVLEKRFAGKTPNVIVFDTLQKYLGGDSNGDDMGSGVKHCEAIAKHFNCLVVIIHHQGKDAAKGLKGNSSLPQGVDTIFHCAKKDGVISLTNKKQKNALEGVLIKAQVRLVPVDDGRKNVVLTYLTSYAKVETSEAVAEAQAPAPKEWTAERKAQWIADQLPVEGTTINGISELVGAILPSMNIHTARSLKTLINRHPQLFDCQRYSNNNTPTIYKKRPLELRCCIPDPYPIRGVGAASLTSNIWQNTGKQVIQGGESITDSGCA